jgi:hypothetical protein
VRTWCIAILSVGTSAPACNGQAVRPINRDANRLPRRRLLPQKCSRQALGPDKFFEGKRISMSANHHNAIVTELIVFRLNKDVPRGRIASPVEIKLLGRATRASRGAQSTARSERNRFVMKETRATDHRQRHPYEHRYPDGSVQLRKA